MELDANKKTEYEIRSYSLLKQLKKVVPEDFFFLGGLKYVTPRINILNSSPSLKGSDAEKEKYEKLHQLSYCLARLEMRTNYLKTYDGMLFVPVAIQNISTLQDENISVVLKVETGEIVEQDDENHQKHIFRCAPGKENQTEHQQYDVLSQHAGNQLM